MLQITSKKKEKSIVSSSMYLQTLITASEQDDAFLSNACTEHFIHYLVVLHNKSPVAEHIMNPNFSFKLIVILPRNT